MILLRRLPPLFWVVLVVGVALSLLLRTVLDYPQGRAANIVLAIIVGSLLFWLKGRSARTGRSAAALNLCTQRKCGKRRSAEMVDQTQERVRRIPESMNADNG